MATATRVQTPDLVQILRDRLTMAYYPLGQKLRSSVISDEFGMSASTAREVMLRLAGEGLLDYEDQRGFRVTPSSTTLRREIAEFRLMLEQEGAARSIANGGIEWEAELTAAHHKLAHIERRIAKTDDVGPYLLPCNEAELAFHLAVMSAAEMPLLQSTFREVYARFRQQTVSPLDGDWNRADNPFEHQQILETALDRDVPACKAALRTHLSRHLNAST